MATYPYAATPCGAKVMSRCEASTSNEPVIIQVVALPVLSTSAPKSGVNTIVKKGIIESIHVAVSSSIPNSGIRIEVPNFLKRITQQ